jgi:electron-transferring-flavoprotein dehydrogenase
MKSGMMAAEAIHNNLSDDKDILEYQKNFENSWIHEELHVSRNFKGGFDKGLFFGLAHGGLT